MLRHWSLLITLLFGTVLAGCGTAVDESATLPSEGDQSVQPGATIEDATASDESAAAEVVSLELLDWESTWALREAHPGKVVVMDLWATYCPPCVTEFPHLVQLQKDYPDQVACVSVSLDYDGLGDAPAESHRDKVQAFLEAKNAIRMTNVLCTTDTETLFNEKIEHGSMPVVFVFDQQGELAAEFPDVENPGEFTYNDHVLPVVMKLLASE